MTWFAKYAKISPMPMTREEMSEWLADQFKRTGLDKKDLALRWNARPEAVSRALKGTRRIEGSELEIAKEFFSNGGHISSEEVARGRSIGVGDQTKGQIPFYGAVEGGEGDLATAWEVIEYVDRPAPLFGVRDGYGMYVVGESMEPAFQRGNRVFVNAQMPPRQGDDVLLFQYEIHRQGPGLIKRFIRSTPKEWFVEQFNPPKKLTLPKTVWRYCHVVVARYPR